MESINKAQRARLEELKVKPPEIDISQSEYELKTKGKRVYHLVI